MLQANYIASSVGKAIFGSEEDEIAALKFLAAIEVDDIQLKETVIFHLVNKFEELPEVIFVCSSMQYYDSMMTCSQ